MVLVLTVVFLLVRRWRAATRPARRVLTPVYLGGIASVLFLGIGFALQSLVGDLGDASILIGILAFASVPVLFLIGILRTRLSRTVAARMLQETADSPTPEEAQEALRRALHDPTLRLLLWEPEGKGYVDVQGRPVEPPADGVRLDHEGEPLAVVVHDPVLRSEPELVDDVLSAARLAMAKDRSVQALRASERRNRALLDAIPDYMFRISRDGIYLDYHTHSPNDALTADGGIVGKHISAVLPPPVAAQLTTVIERVVETGVTETFEDETDDGGRRTFFESRVVRSGPDEVTTIVRDVTARHEAGEEIRNQRDFLRTVVNVATSIFLVVTPEGNVVRFNEALQKLSGQPDDDSTRGRPFWEVFVVPEQADEVRDSFRDSLFDARRVEHEHRWHGASGATILVEWSAIALVDETGAERRLIHGVDVTARRRQEEELRQRYSFLSAVGDATPSLLASVERDGRVGPNGVNPAFAEALGYGDEETIGRDLFELVTPDPEAARAVFEQAVATQQPAEREGIWLAADGRRLSVAWSVRPLGLVHGRDSYLVCGVDVTEQKRQQEEIRRSRARIVEAESAERRRLERNLHDGAQQRLVSLSLALRLAQARLGTDPEAAREIIGAAAAELALALEELRELARGLHPAILSDRGLAAALEALAQRAPLPVEIEALPARPLPKQVEAGVFYVVSESLTNVAKYAAASHVRVRVTCEAGHAIVEVVDDGVGGADPTRGTGLNGLVDRVEALDGRLVVESPPGEGTRVRAVVPLPVEEPAAEVRLAAPRDAG